MLINYIVKLLIIPLSLIIFLSFKNHAKELEKRIIFNFKQIEIANKTLDKKQNEFSKDIQSKLKPHKKNYDKASSILIENFINKDMAIIRVYHDKKSY